MSKPTMDEVISKVEGSHYSKKATKYSDILPDLKHHIYMHYWFKLNRQHEKREINIYGTTKYRGTPKNISFGKGTSMSHKDIIDYSNKEIDVKEIKADIIICKSITADSIEAKILDVKKGGLNCDNVNVENII